MMMIRGIGKKQGELAAGPAKATTRALTGIVLAGIATGCSSGAPMDGQATTSSSTEEALRARPRIAEVRMQTNVVTNSSADGGAGPALSTDPELQNGWGIAFSPSGTPWVSANGTGLDQVYNPTTGALLLSVTVAPPKGQDGPATPTGQLFNGDSSQFMGDKFIVSTEDGTISGWQGGSATMLRVDHSPQGAVYKGFAIAKAKAGMEIFAADFHNAAINVFDTNYMPVKPEGRFVDPFLPRNYAPFNILEHDGNLIVNFAQQKLPDKHDDQAGAGHGFIDLFDTEGHLLNRLVSRGALNSPWALQIAPSGNGAISGDLVVGNFGDGMIHTYELEGNGFGMHAELRGAIGSSKNMPLVIDGLWGLKFAPDAGSVNSHQLWFSAGPDDEANGLFGHLDME
jgi:uncharacterized protein (TIGR03118 family)